MRNAPGNACVRCGIRIGLFAPQLRAMGAACAQMRYACAIQGCVTHQAVFGRPERCGEALLHTNKELDSSTGTEGGHR